MNRPTLAIALSTLVLLALLTDARAQISPTSSTANWVAVLYGGGVPSIPDPGDDQSTGSSEADIVGNTNHPSFYSSFWNGGTPSPTDGQIGFRMRIAAEKSPTGFSHVAFVGLDGNADGRLDLFLGVDNQGSGNQLRIWRGTAGTGLNVSPDTLSINSTALFSFNETAANYNWSIVTSANDPPATDFNVDGALGASEGDRFLTFVLPFADVVTAMGQAGITNFTESSQLRYLVGTSTQVNNINQDLNGINGGLNSTTSFVDLSILTQTYTAGGVLVPEPGNIALLALGGLGLALQLRSRRARR